MFYEGYKPLVLGIHAALKRRSSTVVLKEFPPLKCPAILSLMGDA